MDCLQLDNSNNIYTFQDVNRREGTKRNGQHASHQSFYPEDDQSAENFRYIMCSATSGHMV